MNSFVRLPLGRIRAVLACVVFSVAPVRGDVVLEWNEALMHFSRSSTLSLDPHVEARAYAMAHLAIDEAIVGAAREARPVGDTALQCAAAASAAQTVLTRVLPSHERHFNALATKHLAVIAEGPDKARGIALGRAAAELVLGKHESDNWIQLDSIPPPQERSSRAGLARTLRDGRPPESPWLKSKPFVLRHAGQITAMSLHWITFDGKIETVHGLVRARIFDAVDRSAASVLSDYWAERPVITWNHIACRVSEAAGHDLATRARLLAMLNLALADAALGASHWQFVYSSWRPSFSEIWVPGNGVPVQAAEMLGSYAGPLDFERGTKLTLLPPLPNFPAVPAALAGAAQAVLSRVARADRTALSLPAPLSIGREPNAAGARPFKNVVAAARECAFAATLDGRHSREACVSGYEYGVAVGDYVAKRIGTTRR